jgi:Pentapeptide repeats (9 copies)
MVLPRWVPRLWGRDGSVSEGFTCEVDEHYRSACEGLNFYGEHEGKRYCVLHFPGEEKKKDFRDALDEKVKHGDFNFAAVYFPADQGFESCKFDAKVNFSKAIFHGEANFSKATFHGEANFDEATFHEEVNFQKTIFKCTVRFVGTTFKGPALFWEAMFKGDAYFVETKFLKRTGFSAHDNYKAFNVACDRVVLFDKVEIEKPELFAFRSIQLRPSWLIYVDNAQELTFHEVSWYGLREGPKPRKQPDEHNKTKAEDQDVDGALGEDEAFRREVNALENRKGKACKRGFKHPRVKDIKKPYRLLASTYRRLSRKYEDNREYPLANEFHYWSMDALRKEGRRSLGLVGTLYWVLSGYGVRARRALGVLLTIALMFAVLYMLVGHSSLRVFPIVGFGQVLADAGRAVMYSLGVMARLRPEPIPKEMGLFQMLVTVEGILGPLQIALLALAVRRKVMR